MPFESMACKTITNEKNTLRVTRNSRLSDLNRLSIGEPLLGNIVTRVK